ncbi:hypothetical protein B0T24DRAFT_724295 [Lasiosphaeria ovina]|uniref:Monooxygenase n=1 Tax=Lasiosphaeria ovina TaxID=92902 RepID=A0AAE0JU19_9PEZI|nr:hypothetical protein B0T24DRAFT_724295 [Lasiosphaeria ovina]
MATITYGTGLTNGKDNGATYFDTIIVGAGINAAYRIQTEGPTEMSYAIFENRDSLGGTWDLFRYPGIRSDSDIFTFGFPWSPWMHGTTLASGDWLKSYITQAAQSRGIDHHILYRHRFQLESGLALHPYAIVTATGLKLRFGGGIDFAVDGQRSSWADKFAWRATMLQDVPNLVFLTGYETASWTSARAWTMADRPMMSLTSTYLKNIRDVLPKGGDGVWSPKANCLRDMAVAKWESVSKDLEFM